jgi:hypothetical protein
MVELQRKHESFLGDYLDGYGSLIGDKRTEQLFRGTIHGIIGAESLVCTRIAAFSPSAGPNRQQR